MWVCGCVGGCGVWGVGVGGCGWVWGVGVGGCGWVWGVGVGGGMFGYVCTYFYFGLAQLGDS